jgi:hypothetical protein
VFFIQRDNMVKDLVAAASDPCFSGSVLPWRVKARSFWLEASGLQERNHIGVEDCVAIQNGVAIRSRLGEGFSQLLHDPIGRRMPCNVEVQDPAATVLDGEETVQHSEVAVGTVKRSKATIGSSWLRRNASHCLAGSLRRWMRRK